MKRYALLDTDFISKTHSVQDDGGNHLIDRVMELPEYKFFCHAQIVTELNRYNADAPIWLSEKIGAQKIKSYTDQEILESLSLVRGPLACATYTQMLKLACDAFSKDYFSEHYRVLEEADYTVISREDYLKELERLDIEVGKKNNLGEIKSFVLLQVLSVMLGEQIYVFCSDDKNARNGATNFEDVRCISLVSVFSRLKEESNWTLADAEPYIESLIAFYQDKAYGKETTYTIAPVILWDSTRVWKILTAYVYTGAMVLGKSQRLISGKSISRTVPKGQQYITEGTHEAIVSREEFEKAQLVINNRNKVVMGSVDFPLKGKVRCGNCRRAMGYDYKQTSPIFWCREGQELIGQTKCSSEIFQANDAITLVSVI